MTMKEIRETIKRKQEAAKEYGLTSLVSHYEEISYVIETLWRDGVVREYSNDIVREANGFQLNSGNYETFRIMQTLNLHSIEADKKATKAFAAYILNA